MSSLFSDPSWRRGGTLLGGEAIELDADGNPIAGREVIGQVKIFQDVNPQTGAVNSGRVVYCVAARYTGGSDIAAADIGKAFVFSDSACLSEFSALADDADVVAGKAVGVLDEYIQPSVTVRPNDIVWLVVKGPCSLKCGAVNAGEGVSLSVTAGAGTGGSSGATNYDSLVGQAITATANGSARVNLIGRHA